MKLTKAIEITEAIRHTGHYQPTSDDVDAIELLIEAGKLLQRERILLNDPTHSLLPGETE